MVRLSGEEEAPNEAPVTSRNLSKSLGSIHDSGALYEGATVEGADEGMGDDTDEVMGNLAAQDASPLIKQKENKKKEDNNHAADRVVAFFQENFGAVSPYVSGELLQWVNHSGEQLVLHAMKRALDRGKTSWGYVRAILENWGKKGVRSMEEAREEEVQFRGRGVSRKGLSSYGVRQGREEVVPEWFWERKRGKKMERECGDEQVSSGDAVEESKEIRRMLVELG